MIQSVSDNDMAELMFLVIGIGVLILAWKLLNALGNNTLRKIRGEDANRCAICGYDLRASPEHCPECGTPAQLKPTLSLSAIDYDQLARKWPHSAIKPRVPDDGELPLLLFKSTDSERINLLADYMTLLGLAILLKTESTTEGFGTFSMTLPRLSLFIYEKDFDAARSALSSFRHGALSADLDEMPTPEEPR